MRVMLAIAIAVTGAPLFAAGAQPNTSSTPNPPIVVTGTPTPAPPRMICRRVEALSGSHLSRARVCRTAAQWRAMSDSSVDDATATIDQLSQSPGGYENGVTPRGGSPR